jgi:hypothetical protein
MPGRFLIFVHCRAALPLISYLLSPSVFSSQPPVINGFGTPGTRITLLGSRNPGNVFKDPDSLIFSEILEFAMSLLPTVKGQEPFHGLPHLQAYRFVRAIWLAEMGDVHLASRCVYMYSFQLLSLRM